MNDWQVTTLDQVGQIITGKTPKSNVQRYFGGNIPFVTPSDMDGRRIIKNTSRYLTEEGANTTGRSRIPKNSVMVSCIGSDMGKSAITDRESVTNQQINSIIVDEAIDPLYVYYDLSQRKNEIKASAGGSAQPILNKSAFGRLSIRLPLLKTQRAITSVLSALDDKIEQNRRTAQALEKLARAIFRAWFVDFEPVKAKAAGAVSFPSMPQSVFDALPTRFVDTAIGLVPEGWAVGQLGDIVVIHDSRRIPLSRREREKRRGLFRYYGATGILDWVDDYLFDGTFVLVGEDGTVINERDGPIVQYVWGKFWVNNHAHILTGADGISVEYVKTLLEHVNIRPFITGAVQLKLNQRNMKAVPIVIPNAKVIVAFDDCVQPIFSTIRQLHGESIALEAMRDYLLPKLLSGSVRVEAGRG